MKKLPIDLDALPPKLKTPQARQEFAAIVCDDIRAGRARITALRERGLLHERLFRNLPSDRADSEPESANHPVPVIGPKAEAIASAVHDALFGTAPYLTIWQPNRNDESLQHIEADLHTLMLMANVPAAFLEAYEPVACWGRTLLQLYFDVENSYALASLHRDPLASHIAYGYVGPVCECVHPLDTSVWPDCRNLRRAKWIGRRFTRRRREIEEMQALGQYFRDEYIRIDSSPTNLASERAEGNPLAPDPGYQRTSQEGDEPIELWTGIGKYPVTEHGYDVYCEITAIEATNSLLSVKLWPLSGPDFFPVQFHHEAGHASPEGSLAFKLQGIHLATADLFNLTIDGLEMAAFPAVSTPVGHAFQRAFVTYRPGEILDGGPYEQVNSSRFDASAVPLLLDRLDLMADRALGVSQLSTGTAYSGAKTASEIMRISEGDRLRRTPYVEAVASSLEAIGRWMLELYYHNYELLHDVYGDILLCKDRDLLRKPYIFVTSGRFANHSPSVRLAVAEQLWMLAQDPESGLDKREIAALVVDAAKLGANQKLQLSKEEHERQLAASANYAAAVMGLGADGTPPVEPTPGDATAAGLHVMPAAGMDAPAEP